MYCSAGTRGGLGTGEHTGIMLFRQPGWNGREGGPKDRNTLCMYVCMYVCMRDVCVQIHTFILLPGQESKKDSLLLDPEEDLRRNHQRNAAEHEPWVFGFARGVQICRRLYNVLWAFYKVLQCYKGRLHAALGPRSPANQLVGLGSTRVYAARSPKSEHRS